MKVEVRTVLRSPAFAANGRIPRKYTCDGANISPPLVWEVPERTWSVVLIMEDPDAYAGTWVHWVVYDLPSLAGGLYEGVPNEDMLDNGARQGMSGGVQSFTHIGYTGPCPPEGTTHRYFFKLYALDKMLGLGPRVTKDRVLAAMKGHVLAEAQLVGIYGR